MFQSLGKAINEQFSVGERSGNTLNTIDDSGRVVNFGTLGDFAGKFDQSSNRYYLQSGFVSNIRPQLREMIWQQPDMTITVRKKMFSSLVDNFNLDLSDSTEKLFYRASKRLFQNKCKLISSYERLTKIDKLVKDTGFLNSNLIPTVLQSVEEIQASGLSVFDAETMSIMANLRRVFTFSDVNDTTTWITDYDAIFPGELGEGTGVIELTMVNSFNSSSSVEFGKGGCSFEILDPYQLFSISEDDIDTAIADASNTFKNIGFTRFVEIETQNLIDSQKQELNRIRTYRKASPINIIINENTQISKKIRAIIDSIGKEIIFSYDGGLVGLGSSITIDPVFTNPQDPQSLDPTEERLFKKLISNIYLLIGYRATTHSEIKEYNKETNYVRKKMYLHFKGKCLFQPLDIVNIFVSSKTKLDDKLNSGFSPQSTSKGINQRFDDLISGINNFGSMSIFSNNTESIDDIERSIIAGPDFPTWLWRLFKNDFNKQPAGLCVFEGLIKGPVSQKYSDGKYTISISCEDNTGYFNKSQINIKPSVEVYNGELYDPLTPFDISYDASTGTPLASVENGEFPDLLPENIELINSGILNFKSGRFRGKKISEHLFKSNDKEVSNGTITQVLNDPDGFVYRWKEGIATTTMTEGAFSNTEFEEKRSILQTANPFAGQDAMNALSLLIVGQPYNYNTFLKAALENGNASSIYEANPSSYIDLLTRDLVKRNQTWGNFVPFKKLSINDAAKSFIQSGQNDFLTRNNKIQNLMKKRASLMDALHDVNLDENNDTGIIDLNIGPLDHDKASISIRNQISDLDRQIELYNKEFYESVDKLSASKPGGSIKIIGNDISLVPGEDNTKSFAAAQRDRIDFRKRLGSLTMKRLWKVKANQANNLLIIDDQYDNNFDIMAFERSLGSKMSLFESEYSDTSDKIRNTAAILGLEVFADTQGNIQIRPPGYNKIPSSVFYGMIETYSKTGKKIFPEFLESLLFNQIKGLLRQLEIVEDEIRLRCIAVGLVSTNPSSPDDEAAKFLSGSSQISQFVGSDGKFIFLSDPFTGKIGDKDIRTILEQSNPEISQDTLGKPLDALGSVVSKANSAVIFDPLNRSNSVKNLNFNQTFSAQATDRAFSIRNRLNQKKGTTSPTIQEIIGTNESVGMSTKIFNVVSQISNFISERQSLVLNLSNSIKNMSDGINANDGMSSAMFPSLNRKKDIPEILEHMIEYEDNHDLGPGSGYRFVVKDADIINFSISDNAPEYTTVNVNGLFGEGLPSLPSSWSARGPGGQGNLITSAFAVDYDMWRMYGFRAKNAVEAPYFSNPETQCAPMAVYLLNLARANILKGDLTIRGNEYYQPGDVVYIEHKKLLFYVVDVKHNFSYGGTFTTSLSLNYGHSPGEYIPTMLDIVGKFLYNAKGFSTSFKSNRFGSPNGDYAVGSIMYGNFSAPDSSLSLDEGYLKGLLSGNIGASNKREMDNIFVKIASGLAGTLQSIGKDVTVEFRVYGENGVYNNQLLMAANYVAEWLVNPEKIDMNSLSIIPSQDNNDRLDRSVVKIVKVDLEDANFSRAAINNARSLINGGFPLSTVETEYGAITVGNVIFCHVIDVFIVYKKKEDNITLKDPSSVDKNEFDQLTQDAAEKAKREREGL